MRRLLKNVFNKYEDRFALVGNNSPLSAGSHRKISINGIRQLYRQIPPTIIKAIKKHIDILIREGVIEELSIMYYRPIVLVKKILRIKNVCGLP